MVSNLISLNPEEPVKALNLNACPKLVNKRQCFFEEGKPIHLEEWHEL
jgi:hypothetical protein